MWAGTGAVLFPETSFPETSSPGTSFSVTAVGDGIRGGSFEVAAGAIFSPILSFPVCTTGDSCDATRARLLAVSYGGNGGKKEKLRRRSLTARRADARSVSARRSRPGTRIRDAAHWRGNSRVTTSPVCNSPLRVAPMPSWLSSPARPQYWVVTPSRKTDNWTRASKPKREKRRGLECFFTAASG